MSALDVALLTTLRAASVHLPLSELAATMRTGDALIADRVEALRQAGFEIEARPSLGLRLLASPDRLIADDLRARLGPSRFTREIIVLAETDSTNERAAHLGRSGGLGGTAIFAEGQTAGRGRFGRRWDSARNLGLWCSLLLRPPLPSVHWPRLTTWAAVAVARAIEANAPVRAEIKWPNDVLLNGRKVAGMLLETGVDGGGAGFVVVGIGINVNHTPEDFPEELRQTATSLRLEALRETLRPQLAAALLAELEGLSAQLESNFLALREEAARRSSLLGEWVSVRTGDQMMHGNAEALDEEGRLLLRTSDGTLHCLNAGEATLRPES